MIIREIKTNFESKSPIIDNEISNDISVPRGQGDWKYEQGDIISCALFYNNIIKVILREKTDNLEHYKKQLLNLLDKLETMYAFNFNMELGNFKGFLGKTYIIKEIKPFRAKGGSKERFFQELIEDNKIKIEDVPIDPLKDNSQEVLNRYSKEDYESIIAHNISDVIKQHFILVNSRYLFEKYKDRIDKNGWLQGALI